MLFDSRCFNVQFLVLFLISFTLLSKKTNGLKVVSNAKQQYHVVDTNDNVLFTGGDIAFFVEGRWCVQRKKNLDKDLCMLVPQSVDKFTGTDNVLGSYTGEKTRWSCRYLDTTIPPTIFTSFKNMDSGSSVLFEVSWPEGAFNTSVLGSYKSSLANYPSLTINQDILPSVLSWEGSFTQSVRGFSEGTTGGPTVFYNGSDPFLETVVVGSPWNGNWKAFSAGNNQNWADESPFWSPGTSGRISQLPKGYQQSILLFQSENEQGGITGTLSDWGSAMQQSRKPAKGPFKLPDVTLEKIGYQTDNGAMYCFCPDQNCSHTLLHVVHDLKEQGLSMGYLSFQGSGASSGRGSAAPWCVNTWGIDGGLSNQYPLDLTSFQKALGIPLQLYAPYFCPDSPYFDSPEHASKWKSVSSDTSLPGCNDYAFEDVHPDQSREFYDWFFGRGIEKAGMTSFEPDFMNQNYNCVPEFIQNATAAETWQQGMAEAALARNITLQWCYASPTDVLASLDMPALTNFRVSFDFCYGGSWNIGESSLLVWALGAFPSKDTLWSTENNHTEIPGCPWTADHEESAAELHVVLALLSKGPVGLSDAIGHTNATLLKRIIRQDGVLLKPSKPVTAVDSTFLSEGHPRLVSPLSQAGGDGGYVYGTAGFGQSWYFVSFLLPSVYTVTLRDFWPNVPLNNNQPNVLAYRQFDAGVSCQNGTNAESSGCVQFAKHLSRHDRSAEVLEVPSAGTASTGQRLYSPAVTSVWQPCTQGGWILLGELDKYVTLSPQRFDKVECTESGLSVAMTGVPGEAVELTALDPVSWVGGSVSEKGEIPQYTVVTRTATIAQLGVASVEFLSADETDSTRGKPTIAEAR